MHITSNIYAMSKQSVTTGILRFLYGFFSLSLENSSLLEKIYVAEDISKTYAKFSFLWKLARCFSRDKLLEVVPVWPT